MQQIPSINLADLQQLDEKIALGQTKGNKIDKAKKDLFKKITAQVYHLSLLVRTQYALYVYFLYRLYFDRRKRFKVDNFIRKTSNCS